MLKRRLIGQIRGSGATRAHALPGEPRSSIRLGAASLAASALLLCGSAPAPAGPLDGFTSSNVEFVQTIRLPYVGGASVRNGYYYAAHGNGLDIFDVEDPENPQLVSRLSVPGDLLEYEDPDMNDSILLLSQLPAADPAHVGNNLEQAATLLVVDISDKAAPTVMATLPGAGDHTLTCLLDCTWAYGSSGKIIDLHDPANPVLIDGLWTDGLVFNPSSDLFAAHDVTEVRPGMVLTASSPMILLDVSEDPTQPRVLGRSDGSPYSRGGVAWPRGGRDRFILSFNEAGELHGANCTIRAQFRGSTFDTAFKVWDTRYWKKTGMFVGRNQYYASDGVFTDGNPPIGDCVATWFDPHPSFRNGGLVADPFGTNGLKFLQVATDGSIEEVGFWWPVNFSFALDATWINEEIVYLTVFDRGIDILRFTDASP